MYTPSTFYLHEISCTKIKFYWMTMGYLRNDYWMTSGWLWNYYGMTMLWLRDGYGITLGLCKVPGISKWGTLYEPYSWNPLYDKDLVWELCLQPLSSPVPRKGQNSLIASCLRTNVKLFVVLTSYMDKYRPCFTIIILLTFCTYGFLSKKEKKKK